MKSVVAIVRRGLSGLGCEAAYVDLVARHEGWPGTPRTQRVRVMQALSDHHQRHFDVVWALLAVQLFTVYDREDLADSIIGAFHDAKFEGRREREDGTPHRVTVHRVTPRNGQRRRIA